MGAVADSMIVNCYETIPRRLSCLSGIQAAYKYPRSSKKQAIAEIVYCSRADTPEANTNVL